MNFFKKKYTKYIVLGNYSFADIDYIVFVRKNLKNNILDFKTKRVNGFSSGCVNKVLPRDLIDTKTQFNLITSEDFK